MGKAKNMEKYCLKWNEFEDNIRQSFAAIRKNKQLFDVTLATDDGQHVKAHRIVLSAGSQFFQEIFGKYEQNNLLVFLKGICKTELVNVIDFMYKGETFVSQSELESFLKTAEDLKVIGLQSNNEHVEIDNKSEKDVDLAVSEHSQETVHVNDEIMISNISGGTLLAKENHDLNLQLKQMVERFEGVWKCRVCGKTSKDQSNFKRHAERHIEGTTHTCEKCFKNFNTKNSL